MNNYKLKLLGLILLVILTLNSFGQNASNEKYEVNQELLENFENKYGIKFEVIVLSLRKRISTSQQVVHKFTPQMSNKIYAYFFYVRELDEISFKGLDIAENLREKFPPKVIVYLANKLLNESVLNNKSISHAMTKMLLGLEKILESTWKMDLENYSSEYANRNIYKREYAGFDLNYYEFIPHQDSDYDTLEISNKILLTHDYIIKKDDEKEDYIVLPDDFRNDLHIDWSGSNQVQRYNRLKVIKGILEDFKKYNKKSKVSNWEILGGTGWVLDENGTSYTIKNDTTDHLFMDLNPLSAGEWMPSMAWTQNYYGSDLNSFWKPTRCNMFVRDFSKEYLELSTAPWGNSYWTADKIHDNLPSKDGFLKLEWKEVWEYTNAGLPVFITSPTAGVAGHIAIAYPVNDYSAITNNNVDDKGMIVQAGSDNGVKLISNTWSKSSLDTKVTSYLYLGHLIQ